MSKPDTWMPLYIGDYIADTMHLNTEQHGAYLLLLMTAWNRGGRLPSDETQLALICRADRKAWGRIRGAVLPFFEPEGDYLIQPRLVAEYERAVKLNDKQKANGAKGGRPKKTQNKPVGFVSDNPNHNPNETPSPSPTPKPKTGDPESRSNSPESPAAVASPAPDRTQIDPGFVPDTPNRQTAVSLKLDVDAECARFVAHYTATGDWRANWQAQFRKWLLDSMQHQANAERRQGVRASGKPNPGQRTAEAAQRWLDSQEEPPIEAHG
jgi:uncharacterized protein YdaU (DUF1376 family)